MTMTTDHVGKRVDLRRLTHALPTFNRQKTATRDHAATNDRKPLRARMKKPARAIDS
jgi:hypothetical protein